MDMTVSLSPLPNASRSLVTVWWLTALAAMVSILMRRIPNTLYAARRLSWQQMLTMTTLAVSAAFMYGAAILELGVGSAHNATSCSVGILLCFLAYGLSKLLLFAFYTERIYLVWSTSDERPLTRAQSKWYRASGLVLFLWWAGGMSMLISRFSYRSDNEKVCYLGLKPFGSITVVVMQGIVNIYFTVALLLPLWSAWLKSDKGRKMARSSATATLIAFVVSTANIIGIVVHGEDGQQSWLCMLTCALDIGINALAMFCITNAPAAVPPPMARHASFISQFGTALPPAGPLVPPQNFGVGFETDRESLASSERHDPESHVGLGRRASEMLSPALMAFAFPWPRRGSKDAASLAESQQDLDDKV